MSSFQRTLRAILVGSRWSMAPLCLGLVAALAIVLVQFFRELWHAIMAFSGSGDGDIMIAVLKLVDLALIANLVIMIVNAGADILTPQSDPEGSVAGAHSEGVAFGLIKLKLFASISAIAAIYLLERFINAQPIDSTEALWEILILLTFVVSGVLLAWMDRLADDRH